MRTLLIFLLAAPAYGQERTWTIATDTYTANAELVEVRGDVAYLRTGDKIESVPIANLSAADQQYIASLPLAPILPGPADDSLEAEMLPVPGKAFNAMPPQELAVPEILPTYSPPANSQAFGQQGPQPNVIRRDQYGRPLPPSASGPTPYRSMKAVPGNADNYNARRYAQEQKQKQARAAADAQRTRDESRRGLAGRRARRLANQ